MENNIIEFIRSKDFRFIKNIGQGGTGKTVLLKDEIIDEYFICKKYSPYNDLDKEKYFKNFIDEIKILHLLFHRNIVRVFNYYLYPEKQTGYILMEYIQGTQIYEYIKNNPDKLNSVFAQTIDGFRYLEENNILHRDIRPDNILICEDGLVKIIDFGFGKRIEFENDYDKSITLNWRYTIPNDFNSKLYDYRTEVYFIGKLFEEIIIENGLANFAYPRILGEMIKIDYDARIHSFFEISRKILSDSSETIEFSDQEKQIYKYFATGLENTFSKINNDSEYKSNIDIIIMELDNVYRNSILEDIVQSPNKLAGIFVKGDYYYNKKVQIYVETLKSFLNTLKSASLDKRKIILNNLWQRLDNINRYANNPIDDLPF
jgi:eukaryotic-like serine/threonine-protein kinase